MLDNLRDQASSSPFFQDDEPIFKDDDEPKAVVESKEVKARSSRILGMTSVQRFVISVMLLMVVCILGTMVLLVFERILPPFLY